MRKTTEGGDEEEKKVKEERVKVKREPISPPPTASVGRSIGFYSF